MGVLSPSKVVNSLLIIQTYVYNVIIKRDISLGKHLINHFLNSIFLGKVLSGVKYSFLRGLLNCLTVKFHADDSFEKPAIFLSKYFLFFSTFIL